MYWLTNDIHFWKSALALLTAIWLLFVQGYDSEFSIRDMPVLKALVVAEELLLTLTVIVPVLVLAALACPANTVEVDTKRQNNMPIVIINRVLKINGRFIMVFSS